MTERANTFKKILFTGCIVISLCAVALLGSFAFMLLSGKGEPANLNTATRVTQKFLESIHAGDIESAHSMLSEKFSPSVTVEQFAILLHQDENIFHAYNNWKICDWGLFISDGYVIDTSGLLAGLPTRGCHALVGVESLYICRSLAGRESSVVSAASSAGKHGAHHGLHDHTGYQRHFQVRSAQPVHLGHIAPQFISGA